MDACALIPVLVALGPASGRAEPAPGSDRGIVVGLGAAAEVGLPPSAGAGASAFAEIEPVEDWLEVELGVQTIGRGSGRETSIDLLFKKPFRLMPRFEIMLGLGPTVVFVRDRHSWGAELAVDLMSWPWRRVGLWAEPAYDLLLGVGATRALQITAGPMARW